MHSRGSRIDTATHWMPISSRGRRQSTGLTVCPPLLERAGRAERENDIARVLLHPRLIDPAEENYGLPAEMLPTAASNPARRNAVT